MAITTRKPTVPTVKKARKAPIQIATEDIVITKLTNSDGSDLDIYAGLKNILALHNLKAHKKKVCNIILFAVTPHQINLVFHQRN